MESCNLNLTTWPPIILVHFLGGGVGELFQILCELIRLFLFIIDNANFIVATSYFLFYRKILLCSPHALVFSSNLISGQG